MMRSILGQDLVVHAQHDRGVELVLGGALEHDAIGPGVKCFWRLARSVNRPVDSSAIWQPSFFHGNAAGSFSVVIGISLPLTTMLFSRDSTVPLNRP